MSLLSNFLGTEEFSLMDSPMFQELVENIKANKIYSVNNEFDYDLNSITKVNAMPKYNIKNKKSCFSYLPIDSENLITTKENSEVAA
ncbi:hypothetical protein IAI19_09135 [Streptococcus pseudopneumoniae]|uniref:hypothetical protein n=1 Tax=Streptococcus pseudopneumoniae TaxID=257758 RepID=UPI0018B06A09|nr:hypothetical protein [Streptococcus pseudopneumoniae]MBF9672058.1 hypothetical protein [Streptococcus pseudopneumoniae]